MMLVSSLRPWSVRWSSSVALDLDRLHDRLEVGLASSTVRPTIYLVDARRCWSTISRWPISCASRAA